MAEETEVQRLSRLCKEVGAVVRSAHMDQLYTDGHKRRLADGYAAIQEMYVVAKCNQDGPGGAKCYECGGSMKFQLGTHVKPGGCEYKDVPVLRCQSCGLQCTDGSTDERIAELDQKGGAR